MIWTQPLTGGNVDPAAEQRLLLQAIRRITHAVDIQSRRIEREAGLTLPQLVVLGCISDLGDVTVRALSAEASLSSATVVAILDRLEAKGLVARRRSAVDRRVVHASLTPAGEQALAAAPPPLGQAFTDAFGALPPARRAAALEAFATVAALSAPRAAALPEPSPPAGDPVLRS
jgi:DNA-binding MarR family transcriptional regulator